jgi:hypothetical protein
MQRAASAWTSERQALNAEISTLTSALNDAQAASITADAQVAVKQVK